VGYTPTIVAGFWFGFDTPRSLGDNASGGRLAAPAWAQFYKEGWKERANEKAWAPPEGMVLRVIDGDTGELAGEWCPNPQREWFKPGTEPTHYCNEHAEPQDEYWQIEIPKDVDTRVQRIIRRFLRRM
jgi:penicillin-binding protein 1A